MAPETGARNPIFWVTDNIDLLISLFIIIEQKKFVKNFFSFYTLESAKMCTNMISL